MGLSPPVRGRGRARPGAAGGGCVCDDESSAARRRRRQPTTALTPTATLSAVTERAAKGNKTYSPSRGVTRGGVCCRRRTPAASGLSTKDQLLNHEAQRAVHSGRPQRLRPPEDSEIRVAHREQARRLRASQVHAPPWLIGHVVSLCRIAPASPAARIVPVGQRPASRIVTRAASTQTEQPKSGKGAKEGGKKQVEVAVTPKSEDFSRRVRRCRSAHACPVCKTGTCSCVH